MNNKTQVIPRSLTFGRRQKAQMLCLGFEPEPHNGRLRQIH